MNATATRYTVPARRLNTWDNKRLTRGARFATTVDGLTVHVDYDLHVLSPGSYFVVVGTGYGVAPTQAKFSAAKGDVHAAARSVAEQVVRALVEQSTMEAHYVRLDDMPAFAAERLRLTKHQGEQVAYWMPSVGRAQMVVRFGNAAAAATFAEHVAAKVKMVRDNGRSMRPAATYVGTDVVQALVNVNGDTMCGRTHSADDARTEFARRFAQGDK